MSLQLENSDAQADTTVVWEPVWAYLRQCYYSFTTSSDDAVFSDIYIEYSWCDDLTVKVSFSCSTDRAINLFML